jgi:folate-dependent phosphoribosylglycinamide formyltransferase PurN
MGSRNEKLRLIVLTHAGAEALLQKLSRLDSVQVVGVFVETEVNRRQYTVRERLQRSLRYDGYLATAAKLLRLMTRRNDSSTDPTAQLHAGQQVLGACAAELGIPLYYVSNYHSEESLTALRAMNADLGIIWGTNILKETVFNIPRLGSINIHQGLAPYYRGGPPVFWELFNDECEVGMTVHFVARQVDTGAILTQATLPLQYDYTYGLDFEAFIADFRTQMTPHCVRLMTDAVRMIADGSAQPRPQDTSLGKRYRLPIKQEKGEMRRRLQQRRRAGAATSDTSLPTRL